MGLSGQVGIHVNVTQTPATAPDFGTPPSYNPSIAKNWDILSGVGANQADECFPDERSLATAAFEDLDLSGTTLQNVFGVNIAFVKVKSVAIIADPTNTTNLTVGNAASNGAALWFGAVTHTIVLTPGDFFLISKQAAAGWGITATTADLLRVTNAAGATAKYRIVIIGTRS